MHDLMKTKVSKATAQILLWVITILLGIIGYFGKIAFEDLKQVKDNQTTMSLMLRDYKNETENTKTKCDEIEKCLREHLEREYGKGTVGLYFEEER